jgi:hypothetical protein
MEERVETCDLASDQLSVLANIGQRKLDLNIEYTIKQIGKPEVRSPLKIHGSSLRGQV